MNPIVVNKITRVPYEYLGENKFKNLHTKAHGEVPEDKAKDVFLISLEGSEICNINPTVKDLILKLNLVVDKKDL